MNFIQLVRKIDSEAAAVKFLQEKCVLPNKRVCVNGHDMKWNEKGLRWRCRVKGCDKEVGVRVGNWLQGSRLPLDKIVHFIYCWSYKLSSVKFCERELLMAHGAVVDFNSYCREVCAWKMEQISDAMIGGEGLTVEIDESLFSRRKNHVGRILPQQWIFGGICRETKETFIVPVPDRRAETLFPIIERRIRPGSLVISDCWAAYRGIQEQLGFEHQTVNHKQHFVDPETKAHTQTIENTWRPVKLDNKKRFGTKRDFMGSYMAEHMWRSKLGGRDPFSAILEDIASFWPPAE